MGSMNARGKPRQVLVAGGAGFIGSHLCDALLSQGAWVICVDSFLTGQRANVTPLENHPRFRLICHDIGKNLRLDGPLQEIYNLACAASPPRYQADPIHTMMTSVVGTYNLLELARKHGARFLQASTSEVYGDPEVHPQSESYHGNVNCIGPRACYDEGKRAAEAVCFDYLRLNAVDVRVARIFNTYGPRMRADDGRIVSNLVNQALKGDPLTIYGRGEQTRSFCHVTDMVAGLMALMALQPNPQGPVNLGNPAELTVKELAEMVRRLVPGAGKLVYRPLPADDPQRRRPDITRARKLLGWKPTIPLDLGLEQTIAWFRATVGAAREKQNIAVEASP